MKRTKTPTLEDVARRAGVSTATISRAVNTPDRVAGETRKRIDAAIDALGYTPNFGGRVLASNRSNTVGAIIPSMANAMFANGLQAFQEELSEAGVMMLVASTGYDPDEELRQIRALMAHGADGLLLIGAERPEATRRFLTLRHVPHVLGWCHTDTPGQLFAGFDNRRAAYDATRRVLEMGHRRIAMIAGIAEGNDRARDRQAGVVAAVRDHGDAARMVGVEEAPYLLDDGARAFAAIMAQGTRPTAIICGNDVLAAGAVVEAARMGIRVPRDVSVVGFDDIGLARVAHPALTTVRVPQLEMGRGAARLLLRRLAGESDLRSLEFETELVMRDSLAPPAD